jgi:anthraniloyl-CoA monooxygenase
VRIACLGGGPAGLYFAISMKLRDPAHEVVVFERNRADDTFGWGVVFSDETLGGFEAADPESFAAIKAQFAYWTDIQTHVGGQVVTSTGHGFCGLSRRRLLGIFHERCRQLGVRLVFGREVNLAKLKGKVVTGTFGKGSKSEHDAVFLDTGEEKYRLKRK